jgi:hypothetical protein
LRPLLLLALSILALSLSAPARAADPEAHHIERLQEMHAALQDLRDRIAETSAAQAAETYPERQRLLREELATLIDQEARALESFRAVAADASLARGEQNVGAAERDLLQETQEILLPLIDAVARSTERPRRVESLRWSVTTLERRRAELNAASARVAATRALQEDPALDRELAATAAQIESLERSALVALAETSAELERLEGTIEPMSAQMKSLSERFLSGKGRRLLRSVVAAGGTLLLLLGLRRRVLASALLEGQGRMHLRKPLAVLYAPVAVGLAYTAAMISLAAAGDIFLFNLALLVALMFLWASRQVIPRIIGQLRMVLNLGPVREGEVVTWDGVPWRVEQLGMRSLLVNPRLQGGRIEVLVDSLMPLNSSPVVAEEPWFPTRAGDWALLADGTYGQVAVQTRKQVVLRVRGVTAKTYRTAAFLAERPENLSDGFFLWIAFSVGADLQSLAGDGELGRRLEAGIRGRLPGWFAPGGGVEALGAGLEPSSLHALRVGVWATCDGAIADRYWALRYDLTQAFLGACADEGWSVPVIELRAGAGAPR